MNLDRYEGKVLKYGEENADRLYPPQREIARACGISPTTVNRALDSLAEKGYVERTETGRYRSLLT